MPLPQCELSIDGDSKTVDPVSAQVEVCLSLDELDAITLRLEVPPGWSGREKAAKLCVPGAPYKMKFLGSTVEGDITRVRWQADPGRPEVWVLQGLEKLHRARHVPVSELRKDKKNLIATALVKLAGAKASADKVGAMERELLILDTSALGLLKKLAEERNFALSLSSSGQVVFADRGKEQVRSGLELTHLDVEELEVQTDLRDVVDSVEVRGHDYLAASAGKQVVKSKATTLKKISGGTKTALSLRKAFGKKDLVLDESLRVAHLSEAEERALAEFQARAQSFLWGRLTTGLTDDAVPGAPVEIKGAPWPLMGPFLVRAVRHVFGPGPVCRTEVEFFSDGLPTGP